jgi:uncharacterized BrkB/YihY/UPF0761 family membrane protein
MAVREWRDRVLTAAGRHPSLSAGAAVVRRDIEVGGPLLASALAFRLFLWLLPCCLLLVSVLGFGETLRRAPDELGMSPLASNMLGQVGAQAAHGRYVTAIVGFVGLVWASLLLGRALDRVHERVWQCRIDRAPRPVLMRAARYSGLLLLVVVGNVATPVVVAALGGSPAVVSLPSLAFYLAVATVLLSVGRPPCWQTVWPGALLIAVGLEGLHLAAAVLLWLALMARLVVLGHVLNAVLAERATSR